MSNLNKKEISALVFTAINTRDFSEIINYFDDEIIFNFPGVKEITSKNRVVVFMKTLLRKYPKLEFFISDIILEESRACVIWTNKGLRTDGEIYENSGNSIIRFKDNKIIYLSDYFKNTSFVENK